jgi:hypothetical protein
MAVSGRAFRAKVRKALAGQGDQPNLVPDEIERLQLAIGHMESRAVRSARFPKLRDSEFRVFSQFGEDGIIQYLISKVPIEHDSFIEFGVDEYRESNTRFLLCHDDWRGLILDGGNSHVEFVSSNPIGWRHSIEARSVFITRENINATIAASGFEGDIGLLSVDIDGNDYWVLEAIDVVKPRILVVEYNSSFGPDAAVSVPYEPAFNRTVAHWSNLYWGASLAAVCRAADAIGMAFVGSNSAGNNAFFVRKDLLGELPNPTVRDEWVDARFRESRDPDGNLTYVATREARLAVIAEQQLVDVTTGRIDTVRNMLGNST